MTEDIQTAGNENANSSLNSNSNDGSDKGRNVKSLRKSVKRRSSLYLQELVANVPEEKSCTDEAIHPEPKKNDISPEDILNWHIEVLKKERQDWTSTLNKRKAQCKNAKKQAEKEAVLDWDSCASVLTDPDKEFLQKHPDCEAHRARAFKAVKTMLLFRETTGECNKRTKALIQNILDSNDNLKKDICNYD